MATKTSNTSSPPLTKYIQSLGLSRFRQKRGVTLEQVAEKTKISIRFLRAIEAEEFEKLPGGLFNTSYIRQYAAAVGFDEGDLISQYKEKTAPSEPPAEGKRKSPGSETRNWFGRFLGITAAAPRSSHR